MALTLLMQGLACISTLTDFCLVDADSRLSAPVLKFYYPLAFVQTNARHILEGGCELEISMIWPSAMISIFQLHPKWLFPKQWAIKLYHPRTLSFRTH